MIESNPFAGRCETLLVANPLESIDLQSITDQDGKLATMRRITDELQKNKVG